MKKKTKKSRVTNGKNVFCHLMKNKTSNKQLKLWLKSDKMKIKSKWFEC